MQPATTSRASHKSSELQQNAEWLQAELHSSHLSLTPAANQYSWRCCKLKSSCSKVNQPDGKYIYNLKAFTVKNFNVTLIFVELWDLKMFCHHPCTFSAAKTAVCINPYIFSINNYVDSVAITCKVLINGEQITPKHTVIKQRPSMSEHQHLTKNNKPKNKGGAFNLILTTSYLYVWGMSRQTPLSSCPGCSLW